MFARLFALLATGEAGLIRQRVKTAAIAYTVAFVAAVLAVVFLLVAGYLAAAVRWGAIDAAFWFGIGFAVLTGLVLIAYKIVAAAQRRAQRRKRAADASMLAGASAMAMLPAIAGKKGGTTAILLGLAALAGYAAYREFNRPGGDSDDE